MIGLPDRVARVVTEMPTGVVLLSVPLLDDIIQVGAVGTVVTGTIEVAKTPTTMVVRRTDGRPLQAHIAHRGSDGCALRKPVFCEPARSLWLRCALRAKAADVWVATPPARVHRDPDLFQLIETIASFALAKQRRIAIRDARPAMSGQNGPQ